MGKFAMKYLYLLSIFALLALSSPSLLAQDTSCGIAWGPMVNLSGGGPDAFWPHIAVQGEILHVTWWDGTYRLPYRRSTDGGITWNPIREMLADTSIRVAYYPWLVANSRAVYFVFGISTYQRTTPVCVMKSEDRGSTWGAYDSINSECTDQIQQVSLREDTMVVQYPRPSPLPTYRFFVSTDGAISWDSSLIMARGPVQIGGGVLHNVWVQTINGQEVLYKRSADLGNSWLDSVVISTLDGERSHNAKMTVSDDIPPRVYVMWRDTKYGCLTLVGCSIILRVSGDGGLSWGDEYVMTEAPVGYGWDWGQEVAASGEKVMAVWANDQTGHINMRYSTNRGDSWSVLCDATPGGSTTDPSCAVTSSALHVLWEDRRGGAWNIWYRRGVILANSVDPPPVQPVGFSLSQNYPNPFNSQTRIEYTLRSGGSQSWVTLRIVDLLGREVAQLVNQQQEPGRHSVLWDATNVSSGVYMYRLSVSDGPLRARTMTRTMMLVR
jgi:hypothetical protein